MTAMFFHYFALNTGKSITARMSNQSWPFELITKCESISVQDQLRKYRPHSDFLILKSKLPRLLVEVNSNTKTDRPEDLVRMLVTGAAVVRFANKFVDRFMANKNFVLCAMYIWDSGKVTRYSLFQDSYGPEVRCHEANHYLDDSVGRAYFARQLYNLHHMLESEEETGDGEKVDELIIRLNQHDKNHPMMSFYGDNTKDTSGARGNVVKLTSAQMEVLEA
ncbi:hypothetical protein BJV77DRAFT_362148 [Russula vinacea]|nr:hypothetical protein BJV77DRAFT_362148 [Russula vinacea]